MKPDETACLPLMEPLSIEPNDNLRAHGVEQITVRIVPQLQRKDPHGSCFVFWINYTFPTWGKRKKPKQVKGYKWHYGTGDEPTYCKEWKTLKGIKGYLEKNYGAIIY